MQNGSLAAVTNREDWNDGGEVLLDGELLDISTATITMQINDRETHGPMLTVSTANGLITISGTGTFVWSVPAASMRVFSPETYDVGIVMELDGTTRQLFRGTIPVLDGVVL